MRPEYMAALGDRLEDREMENLEEFGLKYVSGKLPAWLFRPRCHSTKRSSARGSQR